MPERVPAVFRLFLVALVAASAWACSEELDGGGACPALCPSRNETFRDTIIEAVTLDSSVSGFPVLGLSPQLLLANRPDTLVTRLVFRFDQLTQVYQPNNSGGAIDITSVDSVYLRLQVDTLGSRGTDSVTIEVFDVDTTESDSVTSVVKSLFRADRLIGSRRVVPATVRDTLRIPLNRTKMAEKIVGGFRLRTGVRITGRGQLRLTAFTPNGPVPNIIYDADTDTTYAPIVVPASTNIPRAPTDQIFAYTVYAMTDVGTVPPPVNTLTVGGYPGSRTYLRFDVPRGISDSSTIVRAQLLLTQRPSFFGDNADTTALLPIIPTASLAVTDLRRVLELSADGAFAALDSTRLVPRDSGLRTVNVLSLVRSWPALPATVPRALAFRISREGAASAELRFFSSEAPAGLRPRLRITYFPRNEFALP